MDGKPTNRQVLENRIISTANNIHWDSDKGCFDNQTLSDFFSAWNELRVYFQENEDFSIGVEVVREYLYWVDKLSRLRFSERASPECREKAYDYIEELKDYMDGLIKAVNEKLHPE